MNSRKQLRKWDSGFTQTRRRFSLTRVPSTRTQKKHIEVGDMSIEILTRNESVKYVGQRISFYQQETTEIKSRIRAAWATFHKYRQELTSTNYMLKTSSTAFRRHSFSDSLLRSGNMGTQQGTRKNDSIDATQDATIHSLSKQRKYKKIEKQDIGTKEENQEIDINETCSLVMKAEMARVQRLRMTYTVK